MAKDTKKITRSPFDPLVQWLFPKLASRTPSSITPNMVTVAGLVASLMGGLAVAFARFSPELLFLAAALVLVNWITDTLDGVLARQRDQCSKLGDFYDHIFDAFTMTAFILGYAFSGLCHPVLPLLLGLVFLLCFVVTYKGEQVTGVYELLTLGPTEVRFMLALVYVAAYYLRQPLLQLASHQLRLLDLVSLVATVWAALYLFVLIGRYRRLAKNSEPPADSHDSAC